METLTAHILRFETEVETTLRLPPLKGSALRGALFEALRRNFCLSPETCHGTVALGQPEASSPGHPSGWRARELPPSGWGAREQPPGHPSGWRVNKACAQPEICAAGILFAPTDPGGERGGDLPRPFVINPPLDSQTEYRPGDKLTFSLTTFGRALNQFPHTLIAIDEMGRSGLGAVNDQGPGVRGQGPEHVTRHPSPVTPSAHCPLPTAHRGQFRLRAVWASHPLSGQEQRIYWDRDPVVRVPQLPVTHADVLAYAARLGAPSRLTLRFRTPLRLTEQGRFVGPQELRFRTLFLRLHERLSAISRAYCGGADPPPLGDLLPLAGDVTTEAADLTWLEADRYSSRHGRRLPMGGIVGRVTFAGPLARFLPWLVWGEVGHVGKYAVFGHGWYEISDES